MMALREEEEAHLFQVRPANGKMGSDHHEGWRIGLGGPFGDLIAISEVCESVYGEPEFPIVFCGWKLGPADTIIYEVFR